MAPLLFIYYTAEVLTTTIIVWVRQNSTVKNSSSFYNTIESSLIWYFTRQDRTVNLNYGFAPNNMLLSYYIKNLLLRDVNTELNV